MFIAHILVFFLLSSSLLSEKHLDQPLNEVEDDLDDCKFSFMFPVRADLNTSHLFNALFL